MSVYVDVYDDCLPAGTVMSHSRNLTMIKVRRGTWIVVEEEDADDRVCTHRFNDHFSVEWTRVV